MSFRRSCLDCGKVCERHSVSRCNAHAKVSARKKQQQRGATPTANRIRRNINRHDHGNMSCASCLFAFTARYMEVDHILPLVDGGIDAVSNIQLLCVDCHREKTRNEAKARHKSV